MEFEYKSIYREHKAGASYESADDVLNDEGLDGWELISVAVVSAVYVNSTYEIFYLKRKAKTATEQK